MPKKLLQNTALIFSVLLLAGALLLFVPAPNIEIWFLRIFVTEWSWMLCLAAIIAAVFARGKKRIGRITRTAATLAALIYLVPVFQMARIILAQKEPLRFAASWFPSVHPTRVAVDGGDQYLDFYPSGRNERSPCVVLVHGGGWKGGKTRELGMLNDALAREGYAVASVSYRLAPRNTWPAAYDDVVAALKFLRANAERFKIDPDRLVLFGRSAGGELAADAAVRRAVPGIRGCICFYAPLDMEFAYKYGDEKDILHSPQLLRDYLGGTPDAVPQSYRDASPFFFVNRDTVPFLLIHGTKDELVWVKQSRRFAERLRENGVPYRFIELPWATHAFDVLPFSPGRMIALSAIFDFLKDVCASGQPQHHAQ